MKKKLLSLMCVVLVFTVSISWATQSRGEETSDTIQILGYQISTSVGGIRTLYTVPERVNNRRVSERGLIYGLAGYADESQLTIDNLGDDVKAFAATDAGLISSDNGSNTYAMTMNFGAFSAKAFTQKYLARPYAKLRNGSYVYGTTTTYDVYDVASTLYTSSQMYTESQHNYLYDVILKEVTPSYSSVPYIPQTEPETTQAPTPEPTTAPQTTGPVTEPVAENKTIEDGDLMKIAFALVSSAENSSLNFKEQYAYIEDIDDGRGYTGGIIGFTSGTGDMLEVVEQYIALKPNNNPLAPYLSALRAVNGTDSHNGLGTSFERAWEQAAQDQEMIDAQNKIVREWYLHPAVADAQTDGLSILGQFIYYDAMVMHGPGNDSESFGGIRSAARKAATTPAQGGDEATYLKAFLEARKKIMLLESAHEDLSRINAQLKFINEGNFDMKLPLTWTMYGDSFTLTQEILNSL